MGKDKTFLCMPYCGVANPAATISALVHASNDKDSYMFYPMPSPAGVHCYNFNRAWCLALNSRKREGFTKFAMIHSDVEPLDNGWLDSMIGHLDSTDSDVLSVVLRIKDKRGLTSTCVMDMDKYLVRRLTMHELASMPVNFNSYMAGARLKGWEAPAHKTQILVSSGLWVCRFTDPWVEQVWFEMRDRIAKLPPSEEFPEGRFIPVNWSEDWAFSRQCYEQKLRVFATRGIRANHSGGYEYSNQDNEGIWKKDQEISCADWLSYLPGLSSLETFDKINTARGGSSPLVGESVNSPRT